MHKNKPKWYRHNTNKKKRGILKTGNNNNNNPGLTQNKTRNEKQRNE